MDMMSFALAYNEKLKSIRDEINNLKDIVDRLQKEKIDRENVLVDATRVHYMVDGDVKYVTDTTEDVQGGTIGDYHVLTPEEHALLNTPDNERVKIPYDTKHGDVTVSDVYELFRHDKVVGVMIEVVNYKDLLFDGKYIKDNGDYVFCFDKFGSSRWTFLTLFTLQDYKLLSCEPYGDGKFLCVFEKVDSDE